MYVFVFKEYDKITPKSIFLIIGHTMANMAPRMAVHGHQMLFSSHHWSYSSKNQNIKTEIWVFTSKECDKTIIKPLHSILKHIMPIWHQRWPPMAIKGISPFFWVCFIKLFRLKHKFSHPRNIITVLSSLYIQ